MKRFVRWSSVITVPFIVASITSVMINVNRIPIELAVLLALTCAMSLVNIMFLRGYVKEVDHTELVQQARVSGLDADLRVLQARIVGLSNDHQNLAAALSNRATNIPRNAVQAMQALDQERQELQARTYQIARQYELRARPYYVGGDGAGGDGAGAAGVVAMRLAGGGGGSGLEPIYSPYLPRRELEPQQVTFTYPMPPMPPIERPTEPPPTIAHETRLDL